MNRAKIFLDLDGTLAKFNVPNALRRFQTEEGFFARLGAYKGIEHINELCNKYNIFVISASPNMYADIDKKHWLEKYLPNMKKQNIIFCRLGQNKAHIIYERLDIKIDRTCLLLDDYTKNLEQWQEYGGIGIKRLTHCADNSTGKWKGATLKDLKDLEKAVFWATC